MKRSAPTCQASLAQPAQAGEYGVGEHAERHGPHAADAVAQPAEQHAARRGADQKSGRDHAEPQAGLAIVGAFAAGLSLLA